MDEKLHKKLFDRIKKGTFRSLSSFEGLVDFVSNDYLGLSRVLHSRICGSSGSRLIAGNNLQKEQEELKIAHFFQSESALVFNSGYDANLGIFSSIPQKGDVVLYDEHIHASVRDGMRLSLAKSYSFKHNDLDDLNRLLCKFADKTIYVAVEGLYSMDGDFAPLAKIERLIQQYKAYLIIDEAHSAGVFGEDGRGVAHTFLKSKCFIRLVTYGKAYGGHGAVVLSSNDLRSYLINFARPFIYSTALSTPEFKRMSSILVYDGLNEQRNRLQQNIQTFRSLVNPNYLASEPNSPIQMIRGISVELLEDVEQALKDKKIAVKRILPPTVKTQDAGLRVCLHSFNLPNEIKELAEVLNSF